MRCVTVGDRSFAVSAARVWSDLPPDVIAVHLQKKAEHTALQPLF